MLWNMYVYGSVWSSIPQFLSVILRQYSFLIREWYYIKTKDYKYNDWVPNMDLISGEGKYLLDFSLLSSLFVAGYLL